MSVRAALLMVSFAAAIMTASVDALLLCPKFPRCCRTGTCWALCPSCEEAMSFVKGIRVVPVEREPCPDALRLINPDPYARPDEDIFPEEDYCLEYMDSAGTVGPWTRHPLIPKRILRLMKKL